MQPVNATQVFNSLVQDLSFGGISLPFVGQAALSLVRMRYWVWWCSSRKDIVMKSNTAELGFGVLLNLSINNDKVRTAAKILLLIIRIEACIKQLKLLLNECDEFWRAVQGKDLKDTDIQWIQVKLAGNLSAYSQHEWETTHAKIRNYIQNVALCAYRLLLRLDKLLMRSIDAHEALHADNEAMVLSIVNGSQLLKKLFENHQELCRAMEVRKPMVEKCLSLFVAGDSKEKTDQLITAVKDTIGQGRELYQVYEKVAETVGEVGAEFIKRGIFGMFHVLNLTRYIPKELLPEEEQIFQARILDHHYKAFPPLQDVRGKVELGVIHGNQPPRV